MLRYAVLRAALWCASLAGVALFAAAVAALGMSGADNDWAGYFGAVRLALSGVPGLEFGLSTVLGVPSLAAAAPALLASLELLLVSLFVAIAVGGVLGAALVG
ncbi:MAG: hypothetical protein IID54_07385, partial [Proteobacteria bacterium]|nr:hypothetical protein [Pseudomonadota bacterium]